MKSKSLHLSPSGASCGKIFRDALAELAAFPGKKELILAPGEYIFEKAEATEKYLPVSNTVSQSAPQFKHIGLLLENVNGLTIEGNGAKLLMKGDMSGIVVKNCRNIELKNLILDYTRPRISEMKVLEVSGNTATFQPHADSPWILDEKGRFCWVNADGIIETFESRQVVQCAAPDNSSNLRQLFNPVRDAVKVEVLSASQVKFTYNDPPPVKIGQVWQFRDPTRRENGVVIADSENILLEKMELNFTPGLGIVAQMSKDIAILRHRHAPAAKSGRVCAAHADCIQISSCYGKVEIAESFFSGSQDDPINIHGTYLGVEKISGKEITLRFCQEETWGWMAFKPGDEICLVRKDDFQRENSARVEKCLKVEKDLVQLELDRELDKEINCAEYVLENMSAYPDVELHDCIFECYPTRGLLLTSAGKCRVYRNEFRQTAARPAIYISGDVNSWYESGGVRDVKIFDNLFRFCPAAAVEIDPKIRKPGKNAVHRNIEIVNNRFENCSPCRLTYIGTEGLKTDIPEEFIEKKELPEGK